MNLIYIYNIITAFVVLYYILNNNNNNLAIIFSLLLLFLIIINLHSLFIKKEKFTMMSQDEYIMIDISDPIKYELQRFANIGQSITFVNTSDETYVVTVNSIDVHGSDINGTKTSWNKVNVSAGQNITLPGFNYFGEYRLIVSTWQGKNVGAITLFVT